MNGITRRDFAKASAAGVAALSLGGLLASCASDNNAASKPEAGADGATAPKNQVVVSMTTGSEPAAGFDPLVSWGCGEHVIWSS